MSLPRPAAMTLRTTAAAPAATLAAAMLLVALPQPVFALNNGLGRTPPMGYNAYDHVGCCATEETMRAQADALVRTGLSKLGYEYVNADCGWIGGRHANGTLYESSAKFPSGMPALARYLHARGLKLGLYTDRGPNDFSGKGLGMKGHEAQDAATMASWGIDYLKVDDMSGAPHTRDGARGDYAAIRDALNATGRKIFFSTCGHSPSRNATDGSGGPSWMAEECDELANACRIASDVRFWGTGTFGTAKAINIMAQAVRFSGPGHWADPDMLFSWAAVGDPASSGSDKGKACPADGAGKLQWCTGSFCDPVPVHAKSQFTMWAVMAAPLLLSFDLRNLSAAQMDVIANPEVIAVNQDQAAFKPMRVDSAGGNITDFGAPATAPPQGALPEQALAPASPCDNATFPFNRTGVESIGLQQLQPQINGSAASPAACRRACCATPGCDTWQWNPHYKNNHEAVYRPSCYGGKERYIEQNGGWQGESRTAVPTPAPTPSFAHQNVWARPLGDGRIAVAFLNVAATTANVECDSVCFSAIVAEARRARAARDNVGRASSTGASATYTVRDLWQRKDLAPCEHCAETGYTVRNLASNAAALLTFAEAH